MADAASAAAATESSVSFLGSLLAPKKGVSYKFIAACHALLVLVTLGLYAGSLRYPGSLDGWWIATSPSVPALAHSLFYWARQAPGDGDVDKAD